MSNIPNINNSIVSGLHELKIQDSLFIEAKPEEYAIALIDTSASTKLKFHTGPATLATGFENSVYGKQCEILKELPHKFFYLMFWSSAQSTGSENASRFEHGFRLIPGPVRSESMELLFKTEFYQIEDRFLTNTALAFQKLPQEWLANTKTVYLVTDGEMGGGNLDPSSVKRGLAQALRSFKGNLSIFTVERVIRNFSNIAESSGMAGSDVFKTIQDEGLTGFVNKFVSYYPSGHGGETKFTHINRTVAPIGYIPYSNQYFLEINMDKFIQFIAAELKDKSEDIQLAVAQKLTATLGILLKNKPPSVIESNIRAFSSLFTVDPQAIYYILGDSLLAEQSGRAKIFADYRSNLTNLYNNAQQKLNENVAQAIGLGTQFCSFPVISGDGMHILTGPSKMVTDTFIASNGKFPKSCVSKTPVFGISNSTFGENNRRERSTLDEQCLRQWTRTVYAKRFSLKPADDVILYLVLVETLAIYMSSSVDLAARYNYLQLAKIMLKKKRVQVEKTELDYLLEGNAPTTNSGSFDEFVLMLDRAAQLLSMAGDQSLQLWLDILEMMSSICPGLYTSQKVHILKHPNYKPMKIKLPEYKQDVMSSTSVYDYSCYITMNDLSREGGYVFHVHKSPTGAECSPIFMVSESGMADLKSHNQLVCPVCYSHLSENDFGRVSPQIESKLSDIYTVPDTKAKPESSEVKECFLIIMRGTVGAGKSTMSNYIQQKYTKLGYKVFVEGMDKYCYKGIAPNKAVQYIQRELHKAVRNTSKTIVVIDTCGDNRSPNPFGIDFVGWKTVEIWPNCDK